MAKIIWSDRSVIDMEDIADFISKDSAKYAKVTITSIIAETEKLAKSPLIGRIVPEYSVESVREIIKGNYRIIYKIDEDSINILTIHHSSRILSQRDII